MFNGTSWLQAVWKLAHCKADNRSLSWDQYVPVAFDWLVLSEALQRPHQLFYLALKYLPWWELLLSLEKLLFLSFSHIIQEPADSIHFQTLSILKWFMLKRGFDISSWEALLYTYNIWHITMDLEGVKLQSSLCFPHAGGQKYLGFLWKQLRDTLCTVILTDWIGITVLTIDSYICSGGAILHQIKRNIKVGPSRHI